LAETRKVTFHDPCYLGRHNGEYDAPRAVLAGGGTNLIEMEKSRNDSFCCGAGGAQFWKEEEPGERRVSEERFSQAVATGAEVAAGGGKNLVERERSGNASFCGGAGGAEFWKEEEPGEGRVSEERFSQAVATGAEVVATGCPFCKVMLGSSESAQAHGAPEVL